MRNHVTISALIAAVVAAGSASAQEPKEQTAATDQRKDGASTNTASSTQSNTGGRSENSSGQKSSSDQASGRVAVVPFVTVLVPVAMENKADSGLANGCWAKLYGENSFQGDTLTLVGPVDMADMRGPFGTQWDDKVNSIKAGPQATVTIYDNANFRDKAAKVKSGEQVSEISQKMGLFEDVESIRISCTPGKSN